MAARRAKSPPIRSLRRSKRTLSVLVALLSAFSPSTAQDAQIDIGLLTCRRAEGAEVDIGRDDVSSEPKKMICIFRPSNSGPEEVYAGAFQAIGEDQQPSHELAMIWIVKGSRGMPQTAGLLQQVYAADRSAPSPHPPPLIGEKNSAIVLQTLADAQALNGSDKQSHASGIIVLVALKLLSSLA